ncbi:MAG: hypothetical protein AB1489_32745, partial [Acidobacteriota bacterium]
MVLIALGDPERASIGILNAMHHTPLLTITKIQGNNRSTIATLQGEQLRGTWNVDVNGVQAGIGKYHSNAPQSDQNDLRWAIDFNELHGRVFTIKNDALFSKIHFSNGMFYTRGLSEMRFRFFAVDGSKKLDFDRQVGAVGAMIDMGVGEALTISNPATDVKVRLIIEQDTRYEVSLTNLPPPEHANIDHFLHFYEAVEERVMTRYVPVISSRAAFGPPPMVCAAVVFGSSVIN